jgi:hypothetical protein
VHRLLLLLAVVLIAAGCGGGGRLSKAEYAKRADAICRKYNQKLRALGRPQSIAALPQYVDRALPVARKGNAELRDLEAPKGEETKAKEWLDQNQAVVAAMERLRDAAKRGNRAGIQVALSEASTANRAANRLAGELGLQICTQS